MFNDFEERYRQYYLMADIKKAKLGVLLLIVPVALLAYNDHFFFGLTEIFYGLTVLRFGFIVYSVLFFVYLNRLDSYCGYFRSDFVWGFVGIVFQLIVNASRPQEVTLHILIVIIIIFVTWLVIPQKHVNRIILSSIITLGELVILLSAPSVPFFVFVSLVFSLIVANIIGMSSSRLLETYRVKTFVTEEKLKENSEKIKTINEKLRVMSSLTRHDVRNKLTTVTGCVYLLRKKHAEQADIVDELNKIEDSIQDVLAIFNFARLYEQLGLEELRYIDVEKAVDEAMVLFSDLPFKIINGAHGLNLLADSLLRQLLYNFIDNTRKYGEKTTAVQIYYEKMESGDLQLIYEDDGVGISEENKRRLFTEGFSTGGSTGFGLFLSKKMIDVYGWKIQEAGELDKGAKFVITIPKVNHDRKENFKIALHNPKKFSGVSP